MLGNVIFDEITLKISQGARAERKINRIVENLRYNLKSGTRHAFHEIMTRINTPLHQDVGLDIIAFDNLLHDKHAYFLIRAFDIKADP